MQASQIPTASAVRTDATEQCCHQSPGRDQAATTPLSPGHASKTCPESQTDINCGQEALLHADVYYMLVWSNQKRSSLPGLLIVYEQPPQQPQQPPQIFTCFGRSADPGHGMILRALRWCGRRRCGGERSNGLCNWLQVQQVHDIVALEFSRAVGDRARSACCSM